VRTHAPFNLLISMQSRPLIMVVEDEESIRNQLSDALPRLGFDVTVAADGLDALEILDTTVQPDLILSDIVMPGMSGIDTIRLADRAAKWFARSYQR